MNGNFFPLKSWKMLEILIKALNQWFKKRENRKRIIVNTPLLLHGDCDLLSSGRTARRYGFFMPNSFHENFVYSKSQVSPIDVVLSWIAYDLEINCFLNAILPFSCRELGDGKRWYIFFLFWIVLRKICLVQSQKTRMMQRRGFGTKIG